MKTVYDFVTILIFAGIIVLFLQRSMAPEPKDRMVEYLPACVGCAVANYAGNHGAALLAWVVVAAVLGYIVYVLKPFGQKS